MSFFTAFFQTLASMQTPEMYSIVSRIIFSLVGVVFAVVILALFIIPAIITKKNMIVAIVAGIANFVSALLVPCMARLFHTIPLVVVFNPNNTQEAAILLTRTLLKSLGLMAILVVFIVAFVLSIVYIASCFKYKPAIFAVLALIINIVRYLYVAPYQTLFPVIAKMLKLIPYESYGLIFGIGQGIQFVVYYCAIIIPLLLVLFASLITALKAKKPAVVVEEKAKVEEKVEAKVEAKTEEKAEETK